MTKQKTTTTNKKTAMTAYKFYELTEKLLKDKASAYGITDLGKYYELTDQLSDWYRKVKGGDNSMCKCFVQLAFHAQNSRYTSKIVRFEENFDSLLELCKGFNPKQFYKEYCEGMKEDASVDKVVKALSSYGILKHDTRFARMYAMSLIRGAKYLQTFNDKNALIADLIKHCEPTIKEDQSRLLIKYFLSDKVMGTGAGFSVALTCDFLKELDEHFNFLAKPDIHIKEVMAAYLGKTTAGEYECLRAIQDIVKETNQSKVGKKISVYQLDRMIWLICSGKFFLDENRGPNKQNYIEAISKLTM